MFEDLSYLIDEMESLQSSLIKNTLNISFNKFTSHITNPLTRKAYSIFITELKKEPITRSNLEIADKISYHVGLLDKDYLNASILEYCQLINKEIEEFIDKCNNEKLKLLFQHISIVDKIYSHKDDSFFSTMEDE